VGIGTVLADDPILDCRLANNSASPVKIVLDSSAAIPIESRLLQGKDKIILATTAQADKGRLKKLEQIGAEIVTTSQDKVNLKELLKALYNKGIYSILVEGGARVFTSFLIEGLLDKIIVFISPKIIGGDGKDYVGNLFLREMKDIYDFYIDHVEKAGDDVILAMYPKK
ncbi:MAG TPA: RibD family protein, partial [Tepidanaerobacter syntrophicus]|uniref:RibD family protein n=1 Tax=Tepidanaerobacter syntrophicus TaxID=224999 RepID=UPI00176D7D7D